MGLITFKSNELGTNHRNWITRIGSLDVWIKSCIKAKVMESFYTKMTIYKLKEVLDIQYNRTDVKRHRGSVLFLNETVFQMIICISMTYSRIVIDRIVFVSKRASK